MEQDRIQGGRPGSEEAECLQVRELLSPMLDGELTPEENDCAGRHLMVCESCRRASEELLELHRTLQAEPVPTEAELAASRSRILKAAFGPASAEEGAATARAGWGAWLEGLVGRGWAVAPALALAVLAVLWLRPAAVQVASGVPAGSLAPRPVPAIAPPVAPVSALEVSPASPSASGSIVLARLEAGAGGGPILRHVEAGPDALVMRLDGGGADEIPVVWVLQGESR